MKTNESECTEAKRSTLTEICATRCPLAHARGSAPVGRVRRCIEATLSVILTGAITVSAQGQEAKVHVKGHISALAAHSQMLDRVQPDESIRFSIALPVRNEAQLDALLAAIYTPGNPRYHHYLKTGEFGKLFGATEADYEAVSNFVTAQGLEVAATYKNHLVLGVRGRADKVENAFGFHMMHFRATDGSIFHAPDDDPQVPASIAKIISGMVGLDNSRHRHPASERLQNALLQRTQNHNIPAIGSGPDNSGLAPADIMSCYLGNSATGLNGNGQKIAVVEFDGFLQSDIKGYTNQFGLCTPTPIVKPVPPTASPLSAGNHAGEVTSDIEMAIALASQAQVLVYEGDPNNVLDLEMYSQIADDNLAEQVSTSWVDYEQDPTLDLATENGVFKGMGAQGQSMFASSGDDGNQVVYDENGDREAGVYDPASQEYVTGVGGTTLTIGSPQGPNQTTWASEKVWNDGAGHASGGGYSIEHPRPYYQLQAGGGMGIVNPANGATDPQSSLIHRNVPDVAMNADYQNSPYAIYFSGGWGGNGGTSLSAPLWASYCALVNQWGSENGYAAAGCINFDLYVVVSTNDAYYKANYNDITSGPNNDTSGGKYTSYNAEPGYDNCTGWGSPNGIGAILPPKALTFIRVPLRLFKLEWNPDPVLQENSNLRSTNWVNVTNPPVFSNGVYSVTLPATNPAEFFRLNNSSPCVPPPSGLVHWWPANDNANDIIGGDNGILQGGVTYTRGEVGEAFNFDGTSGYVATSSLINNPQTFSLTLWFQTTTTNGGVLISFDSDQYIQSGDSYDRNIYMDNTGALHFGVWNGGAAQVNTGPGYNDGNWHYVVGTLSTNTALNLYIDGVLVGNNPAVTYAQETYNGYWRIGQDNLDNWPTQFQPNSYFFQGQIDEVAIFNTALSAANAAAVFDAGSGGMCQ